MVPHAVSVIVFWVDFEGMIKAAAPATCGAAKDVPLSVL